MVVKTIQKKITTLNRWKGNNSKEYIVIHDVGVKGQTAKNNVDYFARVYVGASAHYFVDRTSIWQSVEDNDKAWHVGDGNNAKINNHTTIGIEMIVEADGTIHKETKENTKWLVQQLQKKYNVPISKVVRHYDASGKNCPQYLNKDKKWTYWKQFYEFLKDTSYSSWDKFINKDVKPVVEKGDYEVFKAISGFKTAADAKANKNKASSLTKGNYYTYKKHDGMINISKVKGAAGSWINPAHNKK